MVNVFFRKREAPAPAKIHAKTVNKNGIKKIYGLL